MKPWWKQPFLKWPRWIQVALGGLVLIVLIGIVTSGSSDQRNKPANKPHPPAPVQLQLRAPAEVKAKTAVLTGTVSPEAAAVTLDGEPVEVSGGRFRKRVKLSVGLNDFELRASLAGRKGDTEHQGIVRKRTRAEVAEARAAAARRREARRVRREQARQARIQRQLQAKQNFIANAVTIPYNQLKKNPDELAGKKVKYQGQIFQIQEDVGTVILLAVTNEGYDIWDDNVWVDYAGEIKSAEDDIITVYGTVTGSKSYETQIGGETYVPQIKARYIEE